MRTVRHSANILYPRRFATLRRAAVRTCARCGVAFALAPLFIWILLVFPAQAAGEESVFTAEVHVDRTAASAAAARDVALAEGQVAALRKLVSRLVPADRQADVSIPSSDGVAQLVHDFQVDNEKTSSVRYIADLIVRFRPDSVRQLLRSSNVPFAETRSKAYLVLPVYRRAGALLLWDQVNGWLKAWQALPPADGLVPLVVPKGDLADVADIGAEQALALDSARIGTIARRYGAAGGLLAYARLVSDNAPAAPTVEVSISRVGGSAPERTTVESIAGNSGESEDALLARAAQKVRDDVQETWKRANLIRYDERNDLIAVAPLGGIAEWVRLTRALGDVPSVQKTEVLRLSPDEATFRLSFLGNDDQLVQALAQRDIDLTRGPDAWLLRLRQAEPARGGADTAAPQ